VCASELGGYTGKILRVDLTNRITAVESAEEDTLRKYIGGTGLGARILYKEVPPGIEWSDPENRLILASGPLGGTRVPGSGTFSVVTKGPLTNGAASTQANGFFGAYLKFCGFDAIIVQGAARELSYLYISDGVAEIRDANHLAGKDTWETEDIIKKELGYQEHQMSVFGIGPAGENLVRYAAIIGDRGHVAAHNGVGAVMGSKRLKAIAAARGKGKVVVKDSARLAALVNGLRKRVKTDPRLGGTRYKWGTLYLYPFLDKLGLLPIKNYTTNIYPDKAKLETFAGPYIREHFEVERHPCWGCEIYHCHLLKITEGPFAGRLMEEPDYEGIAAFGSQIGLTDVTAAIVLSDHCDRLGVDCNEASWTIGLVMECCEKGIITQKETDGLEMTWGNVEAVTAMLDKIANRQGVGNLLAEGVMRVAQHLGGEAVNFAIHTKKGNTPRSHDQRCMWHQLFDTCVSNTGTIEAAPGPEMQPAELAEVGLSPLSDPFSWEEVVTMVARLKGVGPFEDSAGTCRLRTLSSIKNLAELVSAITGWQFTVEEALNVGLRIVNLLRAFNIRHGIGGGLDAPSPRYGSTPVDGPARGKGIAPFWDQMLHRYYELMGWDERTSKPRSDTLGRLDLEYVIHDIW